MKQETTLVEHPHDELYDALPGMTTEETREKYPFGYFAFPDGSIYGRDPLQEANAGLDVDQSEIDAALALMEEDNSFDEIPHS